MARYIWWLWHTVERSASVSQAAEPSLMWRALEEGGQRSGREGEGGGTIRRPNQQGRPIARLEMPVKEQGSVSPSIARVRGANRCVALLVRVL